MGGLGLGDLVRVIIAVEEGESLQVCRGPGVLALEELVYFALGGRSAINRCGVVFFRLLDIRSGSAESVLCMISWD